MEATIHYAATMAKFSYLYQSYDREFATLCLQASDRAYRYAENYLADVSDRQYFFAAAELYRATGGYQFSYFTSSNTSGIPFPLSGIPISSPRSSG